MAIADTGREDGPIGAGGLAEGEAETRPESVGSSDTPAQLDLGDEEVRLPWLEGDEDEEEEARGPGAAQGLVLVLFGLVAIGVIVGGLYWAMRGRPDGQLVADGGVIEAPDEPYKTRPENPGGQVVDGTGDTSYAVAEGQSRAPRIDGAAEGVAPGFDGIAPTKVVETEAAAPASSGGVGVQVGAYTSKETAEAGWLALKAQYPALAEMSHRVLQGKADIGTVYRLQAVATDRAAARALCGGMQGAGLSCQVKD